MFTSLSKNRRVTSEWRYLVLGLILLDTVGLVAAFVAAYQVRFDASILLYSPHNDLDFYHHLALTIIPVWLVLFWLHGLYDARELLGGFREYSRVVNAITYGTVSIVIFAFFGSASEGLARGWLLLVWALSAFTVGLLRFVARRFAFALRRKGYFVRRVIVAGADEQGLTMARHLGIGRSSGFEVIGFVHDYLAPGSLIANRFRVLGEPMDLEVIARRYDVDLVILVPNALSWESLQMLTQAAASGEASFEVRLLPGPYDVVASRVYVDQRGPVPLLSLNRMHITGIDRLLKGMLDYAGALLLLACALPLALLLSAVARRRPGLLVESRCFLGAKGKPFRALSFNGWWNGDILRKGRGLERFLAARRLHRLPGLLNVLKGEMSLVGPRKMTAEDLSRQPKWRYSILSVKPGLTGLWLLHGGEKLDLEESLRLDMYYIRNYSIWFDFQILFQTAKLLIKGFAPKREEVPKNPLANPLEYFADEVPQAQASVET